jgi:uncharacterized SAM-binding protein YcdF (DUF218 family)
VTPQAILTALLLPPLLFVLVGLVAALLAWRGRRGFALLAALMAAAQLVLATPLVSGALRASFAVPGDEPGPPPAAIIVLGGDAVRTTGGTEVGPLTLERLRAAARLQRETGLPLLVSAGAIHPHDTPLGTLMALSLSRDFGIATRWIEPQARDTHENATLSAALVARDGIRDVYVVTHAWHMPRALAAFRRAGLVAHAAPVRRDPMPEGSWPDLVPSPTRLGESWHYLREWAGALVYRLRDGGVP